MTPATKTGTRSRATTKAADAADETAVVDETDAAATEPATKTRATAKPAAKKAAPAKKAPEKKSTAKPKDDEFDEDEDEDDVEIDEELDDSADDGDESDDSDGDDTPTAKKKTDAAASDDADDDAEDDDEKKPAFSEPLPTGAIVISSSDEDDVPVYSTQITGATADPVKDYLKQIGKVPLLNAAEEVELAMRIEAGLFAEEKLSGMSAADKAGQTGLDLQWVARDGQRAKSHLLGANLRLVVSLAKR